MATAATLTKIKQALRISHSALDDDIMADIDACLADLEMCGIATPAETDPLIYNAVKLYCRAHYTDDTTKAGAYMEMYGHLKGSLQTASGYGYQAEGEGND